MQLEKSLYESDFHAWCVDQADNLKNHKFGELDWENLREEIESLGRQWRRELISRLKILFVHLLKWELSPSDVKEWQKNSWLNITF